MLDLILTLIFSCNLPMIVAIVAYAYGSLSKVFVMGVVIEIRCDTRVVLFKSVC